MKKYLSSCFKLLFFLSLSGCSYLPGQGVAVIPTQIITDEGVQVISNKYQYAWCTKKDDEGCSKANEIRKGSWLEYIRNCQIGGKLSQTQCEYIRNSTINELLLVVDHNYHAYEGGILTNKAKNTFYTGAFRSSLETAGALFNPASTVKALSGLAALTGTIEDSADKEFYFDNTMTALITQMRADRKTAYLALQNGLKEDYDKYSIERAVRDITNYYRAGTLASAVVSITKSASKAEDLAQEKLDDES